MALVSPNPVSSTAYGKSLASGKVNSSSNGNAPGVGGIGAGRRTLSTDSRPPSVSSARIPVPSLNGNRNSVAPPFLDSRKRVSSTPSISSYGPAPMKISTSASHSRSSSSQNSPNTSPYASLSGPPYQFQPQQPQYSPHDSYALQYPTSYSNNLYGNSQEVTLQQHQAMLMQQAQFQQNQFQQQWQMEMMRNQRQQSQQNVNSAHRPRATSGPSPYPRTSSIPSHPYPPSPSYQPVLLPMSNGPTLPPGAMIPQFGTAYPTPPASAEGRSESYHPYKRAGKDENKNGGLGLKIGNGSGSSSSSNSNSSSAISSQSRTDSTSASSTNGVLNSNLEKSTPLDSIAPPSLYIDTRGRGSASSINSKTSPPPTPISSSRNSSITSLPSRDRINSSDSTAATNRIVSGGAKKLSPLSQDSSALASTSATIRNSYDEEEDSDDTTLPNTASVIKEKKGLKQKLKKTFSINSNLDSVANGNKSTTNREEDRVKNPPPSSRKFGILNSKLNSSTDNISISSTVSTASVMLKKLGQFGKLARRNSLMSLTKAFKSSTKEEETNKLTKDKKKGNLAETSVAHVTVELESPTPASGMSPAAALAKKHQQLYAEQEASAQGALPRFDVHARSASMPSVQAGFKANEDLNGKKKGRKWGFGSKGEEENVFVVASPMLGGEGERNEVIHSPMSKDGLPFNNEVERLNSFSLEDEYENGNGIPPDPKRDARPSKSILKGAGTYNQADFEFPRPSFPRTRANSAENFSQNRPLSPTYSNGGSSHQQHETLFEDQIDRITTSTSTFFPTERNSSSPSLSPYSNPTQNHSAPVLHLPPPLSLSRPSSTYSSPHQKPTKKISFALNLSVHTTWPGSVYDRRAEPAACNRLTPTFAQRIKEELNAFKMEEMEVHPGSRGLTHFFV